MTRSHRRLSNMRLITLILLIITAVPASAQVLARAEAAKTDLMIGDQVWLRLQISAPPGTEIVGIDDQALANAEGLEVVQKYDVATIAESPELLLEQRFLVQSFDTGKVYIPPLSVIYRVAGSGPDTTQTREIELQVRTLPVTEESEIQPIKPIIEEPRNWTDFWPFYLALGVLFIFSAVYLALQNRRRSAPAAPPPPLPPHEHALNRLRELEARELWQRGQVKTYHTELTHIIREYFENRFNVPALESTTRQLEQELRRRALLMESQRAELSELLRMADMVKFAQAEPPQDFHGYAMERIRRLIEDTRPAPQPVEDQANESQ